MRHLIATYTDYPAHELLADVIKGLLVDFVTAPALFRTVFFRVFRAALLHNWDYINRRLEIDLNPRLLRAFPESYKRKLTSVQAKIIQRNLDKAASDIQHRIHAARKYHEGLSDLPELILPPLRDDGSHVYWYYPIQYAQRKELVAFAARHGRDITASYHRNCAELRCFAEFANDCPNASKTAATLIYLPTYPRYNDREIEQTIRTIRLFFGC